jgi:hypothetical protein
MFHQTNRNGAGKNSKCQKCPPIRPNRIDEANGPLPKYTQPVCHDTLPWLISISLGSIQFQLACYCGQLGWLKECEAWLKKAMALDEHAVQRAAIDDPDLKPLWDSMSGTKWKWCQ